MPVNDGQERVTAFLIDLQLHAEGEGAEAGSEPTPDPLDSLYSLQPIDGFADPEAGASNAEEPPANPDNAGQGEEPKSDEDMPPGNDDKGNARWAEMRRKAEEADHLRQEIARRDQEMLKRFGEQGIKTFDDLVAGWDRAMDQQRQAQAQQVQQQTATFEQGLNRMVQQMQAEGYDDISISARVDAAVANFKVQQMELRLQQQEQQRALEQKQKAAQQQQLQQQANVEQGTKLLLEDYDNLKKEYGELLPEAQGATPAERFQSLITQLDQETLGKLQRGYTLRDAFVASRHADILASASKKGAQQTLNAVNGRAHLKPSGGTSEVETVAIPDDVLKIYKQLNPGRTHKEYLEHYKKSLKG